MIYGYIRVSTDKQTVKNQKFEIEEFCEKKDLEVEKWISETISATKKLSDRKFGKLLKHLEKGDVVIVSEISRLERNLLQIMSILNECMEKEALVLTVKEGYEMGNNINSKVLAFAFGLSAEIERNLISQRTKEALARKKAEGVTLGRPKGRKSSVEKYKLHGKENLIHELLKAKVSKRKISKLCKVDRNTLDRFIKQFLTE